MKRHIIRAGVVAAGVAMLALALATGSPGREPPVQAAPACPNPLDPSYTEYNLETVAEVVAEVTVPFLMADTITVRGPTRVATSNADGGPIETEMLSMTLTGGSNPFGAVRVTLNPAMQSCGSILNPVLPSDSFFDVFYQIDVTNPAPVTVTNAAPLTVSATIRNLPPLGQAYMFKGNNAFAGGGVQGRVTLVKHIPQIEQRPSWTIDDAGPGSVTNGGGFHPADILWPPFAAGGPLTMISCAGLGLTNGGLPAFGCGPGPLVSVNNVDGFSYGLDFTSAYDTGYLGFSVAPGTSGIPGTAVFGEATCPSPEPETDEFGTILNGANWQIYDGDGAVCDFNFGPPIQGPGSEPAGPPSNDDVDGIDAFSPTIANTNFMGPCPAGAPLPSPPADCDVFDAADGPVYFSLDPSSPALPGIPVGLGGPSGPGDVLVCGPPSTCSVAGGLTPPAVYVADATLGLVPPPFVGAAPPDTDDIDAICLFESAPFDATYGFPAGGDFLFYSLAPGSPSLPAILDPFDGSAGPSDIIFASGPGIAAQIVVDDETALGLLDAVSDNVNALKCVKGLIDAVPGDLTPGPPATLSDGVNVIQPIGFGPPPTPVQIVGVAVTWEARELKTYLPPPDSPIPPIQVIEQLWWGIGDNPGFIRGAWAPQAGDACTFFGNQRVCQNPFINALIQQNDIHFNELVPQGATVTFQRQFVLTCEQPGIHAVQALLDQMPLGANDVRPFDRVPFAFNVDCQPGCAGDQDCDGVLDGDDNCVLAPNPLQENTDGNALDNGPNVPGDDVTILNGGDADGDACDLDDDNDGLSDADELSLPGPACPAAAAPTDPLDIDSDGGHRTDGWECANGTDPNNPAVEFLGGALPDGDGDNIPGHWEMRGYNASDANQDSDGNGCWDMVELGSVDGNQAVTDADRLAVARRALGIFPPEPNQDYVLDIDKNGTVGDSDRLFVARAALLPFPWTPKSC